MPYLEIPQAQTRSVDTRGRVTFAVDLERHENRTAVVDADGNCLSYAELARRADVVSEQLGTVRRLILLAASNDVECLIAYLAALRGDHVVLLTNAGRPDQIEALASKFDPDVIYARSSGDWQLETRRVGSAHTMHPELALLLATSGTSGASKLVRLSKSNLVSNADAIARYLDIRPDDRAATSLPMHYCYGLSVIHSHLARGATLLVSNYSVVDQCFWNQFKEHGGTTFAGVPYTFTLLDRIGFSTMELPALRYVTQAGGRLAPEKIRSFAELGNSRGWDLFVMYGQTEATARMAFLPPEQAMTNPSAIGIPVPGGSIEIHNADSSGEGELFYRGPNVMMGYAESPSDLQLPASVELLATGDIGRRRADGMFEVTGRKSRIVKPCGIRIDLEALERELNTGGHEVVCAAFNERIIVATPDGDRTAELSDLTSTITRLPSQAIVVRPIPEVPRMANGKVDYSALTDFSKDAVSGSTAPARACSVRELYRTVFSRTDIDDQATFVSLGGDSLSYVEASYALEAYLGFLPASWHMMTVDELARLRPRHTKTRSIETGVVLRAVAIFLVVATHVRLFVLSGGAHVLLAIAGWNFARFGLRKEDERQKSRWNGIIRIAVPSLIALGLQTLFSPEYSVWSMLLLSNYLDVGLRSYWFAEVLIQALVGFALLFSLPVVRRLEQRYPFGFPLLLLLGALIPRYLPFATGGVAIFKTHLVLWIFLLGWAAQRAGTLWQRLAVSAAVLVAVPGFFGHARRDAILAGGILLLLWVAHMRVPRWAARPIVVLASASLYIYLTHFMLYPTLLEHLPPLVVVPLCLGVGVAVWLLARRATTIVAWARPVWRSLALSFPKPPARWRRLPRPSRPWSAMPEARRP